MSSCSKSVKTWSCSKCTQQFVSQSEKKNHVRRFHKEKLGGAGKVGGGSLLVCLSCLKMLDVMHNCMILVIVQACHYSWNQLALSDGLYDQPWSLGDVTVSPLFVHWVSLLAFVF